MRADMAVGRLPLRIEEGEFSMAEYQAFLAEHREGIDAFEARRRAAFDDERRAWEEAGEFERVAALAEVVPEDEVAVEIPDGCEGVEAQFAANVFRVDVRVGEQVREGQTLMAVEAMKMEAPVTAPADGVVHSVVVEPGAHVGPGAVLAVIRTAAPAPAGTAPAGPAPATETV
jgi:urea carboxylase